MEVEGAIIPSEGKLVAPDAYSQSVNLVYEFAITIGIFADQLPETDL